MQSRRRCVVGGAAQLGLVAILVWGLNMADAVKPERLGEEASVLCLAFSPDGKWLAASVSNDALPDHEAYQLVVWDLATRKPVLSRKTSGHPIHAIAFSADGRTMAAGGYQLVPTLWETASWKEKAHLPWDVGRVEHLAFRPKGDRLFAAGRGKMALLCVWDVPTLKNRYTRELSGYGVDAFSLSPDGKSLVTGSTGGIIKLLDADSGNEQWSFKGHACEDGVDAVRCAAFFPDSQTFATGGYDHTVRLWDLKTKKQTAKFTGEVPVPEAIDISADGKVLAVGGAKKDDKTFGLVELWDIASGKNLARLKAPGRTVTCVRFSPDGKWLATGTDEMQKKGGGNTSGSLLLWKLSDVLRKKAQ